MQKKSLKNARKKKGTKDKIFINEKIKKQENSYLKQN